MCSGKFVDEESIEDGENNPSFDSQIALGSDTGAIYIYTNFQVCSYPV